MTEAAGNNVPRTRGKPFAKGNPGRPKGARHKSTLAIEALLDGEAEAIGKKCIEKALAGDPVALRLAMERIAPLRKGRPVTFDLPPLNGAPEIVSAVGAILSATARGEMTPEEAATVAQVLEVKRRSIELVEVEERLAKLEANLEKR